MVEHSRVTDHAHAVEHSHLNDPEPAVPPASRGDGGLLRVRLDLAYDGTHFAGWAMQRAQRTVEGELSAALPVVFRSEGVSRLVVAGRTDAGVHATGQVAHVDVPEAAWNALPGRSSLTPAESLVRRLRGMLPRDVRVDRVTLAPPGFDARFSALRRRYAFRISDAPGGPPPLRRHVVLDHARPLDVALMDEAAARLVGLRDFAAFCKRREGATTTRTLLEYRWSRDATGLAVARVVADAFCHSMVRALVGVVLPVGEGRRPVQWPESVLVGGRRDSAVHVVAPHGLVLEEVVYPPDALLATRAAEARNRRG